MESAVDVTLLHWKSCRQGRKTAWSVVNARGPGQAP